MTGVLLQMRPNRNQVEAAWGRYRKLAIRIPNEPRLLSDRAFMEEFTKAEREWKDLFTRMGGGE